MIKFSKKEKEIVHRLHLLSGKNFEEIRTFFEYLVVDFALAYLEKKPLSIPLFGDIFINYLGDEILSKGRKAKIDIDFIPDDFFVKIIGQIEDGEESDLERHLKEKIKKTLESHLNDE